MNRDPSNVMDQTCAHMAEKTQLILTVKQVTPEQAEKLLQWLYNTGEDSRPFGIELLSINWNGFLIPLDSAEHLAKLRDSLQNHVLPQNVS